MFQLSDYQEIYDALQPLDIPIASILFPVDGSELLPDAFVVIGLVVTTEEVFYGGNSQFTNSYYDVTIYTRDGTKLEPLTRQVNDQLHPIARFIRASNDLFHEDTGHYSRTIDFRFYKYKGE